MESSPLIDVRAIQSLLEQEEDLLTWRVHLDRVNTLELPAIVRRLVLLLAEECPVSQACQQLGIPREQGYAIVKRLESRGVLTSPLARGGQPAAEAGEHFSNQEQSFFVDRLPPIDECDLPFESVGQRIWRWLTGRPRV
jgi:hypothetical protein